jgi:hypothetical protein
MSEFPERGPDMSDEVLQNLPEAYAGESVLLTVRACEWALLCFMEDLPPDLKYCDLRTALLLAAEVAREQVESSERGYGRVDGDDVVAIRLELMRIFGFECDLKTEDKIIGSTSDSEAGISSEQQQNTDWDALFESALKGAESGDNLGMFGVGVVRNPLSTPGKSFVHEGDEGLKALQAMGKVRARMNDFGMNIDTGPKSLGQVIPTIIRKVTLLHLSELQPKELSRALGVMLVTLQRAYMIGEGKWLSLEDTLLGDMANAIKRGGEDGGKFGGLLGEWGEGKPAMPLVWRLVLAQYGDEWGIEFR